MVVGEGGDTTAREPRRILLRAGKSPLTALTHEQSLAVSPAGVFASNSGNMLFYSSVHRALSVPGTEIVPDTYKYENPGAATQRGADEINERYDHYVLPMANSYRDSYLGQLDRLSDVIERLTIPVTVVGIGAQMPHGVPPSEMDPDQAKVFTRFTRAVLQRSPSIGVRGAYTADTLKFLGFSDDEVTVVGCPSLFTYGATPPMRPKAPALDKHSRVALNFTPTVPGMAAFLNQAADAYPDSVAIPQQHQRLALMLWGEDSRLKEDQSLPVKVDHPLYQQDRLRFFVDAKPWIDYLRDFDFVVGTRIHGCAAGVLSGTPTLLLAHDSRTVELAEYHGLPYRMFGSLPANVSLDELYDSLDLSGFEPVQAESLQRYKDFLDRHGLAHVYDPANQNVEYDDELADAGLPGPAHTLMAQGEYGRQQVTDRLCWLWQGRQGDQSRPRYAYVPPVAGRSTRLDIPRHANRIDHLGKNLATAQKSVTALQGEVDDLREQLKRQREQLKQQTDTADRLAQLLEQQQGETQTLNASVGQVSKDLREIRAVRKRAGQVAGFGRRGRALSGRLLRARSRTSPGDK